MDIFEQEVNKSTIFKDRNVLSPHYVPNHLPYREKEINKITKVLAPSLSQKRPNNLFIYGGTGTGKTSTTRYVLSKLGEAKTKYDASINSLYLNCRTYNTKYQTLLKMTQTACPNENLMGYAFSHLYEKFLSYLDEHDLIFIVALDELDKVKDLDELLYSLTRANDSLERGHIGIIGISNKVNLKDKLDSRSKSTLCEEEMIFAPYNAEQLQAILSERCKEGFKEGEYSESAVALAAAYAAKESGDARYALRLLVKAGDIADESGTSLPEDLVKKARNAVEEDVILELIDALPEHQGIVLYSIALLVDEGGKYKRLGEEFQGKERVLFSGEVYEKYEDLCKQWKIQARSARWFREYLNEL
ncbi:AAA family ATPase, partial [archaeon]|nr:AAA family ATPase [archaeon]